VLKGREVARAARRAIDVALERLRRGDVLLLFGEGTRSRDGKMRSMLPGVARYLDVPGTWVLPAGLAGPEALFPVERSTLRPAPVVLQLGAPFPAGALVVRSGGDRRLIMDAIGLAVARTVPPQYRGEYQDANALPKAKELLEGLQGAA
jgi:1-acyl-sn-glycerol-3-phosphate acyltransferase